MGPQSSMQPSDSSSSPGLGAELAVNGSLPADQLGPSAPGAAGKPHLLSVHRKPLFCCQRMCVSCVSCPVLSCPVLSRPVPSFSALRRVLRLLLLQLSSNGMLYAVMTADFNLTMRPSTICALCAQMMAARAQAWAMSWQQALQSPRSRSLPRALHPGRPSWSGVQRCRISSSQALQVQSILSPPALS